MAVMLTCFLMSLGLRIATRTICLSFQVCKIKQFSPLLTLLTAILDLFERDYNSHTAFPGVLRHYALSLLHKISFKLLFTNKVPGINDVLTQVSDTM